MTLSIVQPTDQDLNARWPYWIRLLAVAINDIEGGVPAVITVTTLTMTAGGTTLFVGIDLSVSAVEVIILSATGPSVLQYIYNGTSGQIKIFMCADANVSFLDGIPSGGRFYINQPALSQLDAEAHDVIAFVNIGGNGGSLPGYWKELWRTLSVK
jgi:hypothetical protein